MDSSRRQRYQKAFYCLSLLLLLVSAQTSASAATSEQYNKRAKGKTQKKTRPAAKSQPSAEVKQPQPSPRTRVIDASIECSKICNYNSFNGEEGHCFGLFVSNCTILQLFADGHILETKTQIHCIGRYLNETANDGQSAVITTSCSGQFEQTQVLNVYETVMQQTVEGDDVMVFVQSNTYYSSYACRQSFLNTKKIDMNGHQEPALLTANVEVSCDESQAIQIQKAHCSCSPETCAHQTNNFRILRHNKLGNKLDFTPTNSTMLHMDAKKNHMQEDAITASFKKVAAKNPGLAWEVSQAIISSASFKKPNDEQPAAEIHPVIMEYHASQNIYENDHEADASSWSVQPATAWLHVLCNGANTAFAAHCKGMLSANVRFGQQGDAFILCNGGWKAFEDVTYICDGLFTEDESDANSFGSSFSKVSRCSGSVAISPLSSKVEGDTKYYGLSEICNGKSLIQASYSMEELDHRYLAHIVDPRTAEQIICLLDQKNCEQLRYFV